MQRPEIPQLVFATRSPDPKSGSDFVRQVVAESAGVSEEARRELSRRADVAGSVLQFHPRDPAEVLRLFIFHPLSDGTWLFARAVSLGLYRKGSHQLLVHGVVLGEELLDGLEANPLALDTVETPSFRFLDRHPGGEQGLTTLALTPDDLERVRRHNRQRLAETSADQDRWIAAAYDALAGGNRVVCVTADPRPEEIERLLLHFHPDDRMAIGFNTFYAHSRPVDYRLIAVLPEDLPDVRSQFRGIQTIDLAAPPRTAGGLGELVCQLRRSSPADFRYAVNQALLTFLSHRRRQPLSIADATLVLRASLHREPLSTADGERLEILFQRAGGGLAYLVAHLAARWTKDPEELRRALDAATRADEKITREQLQRYCEEHLDGSAEPQRWALAALLTRPEAMDADAVAGDEERIKLWRRLLPRRLLDEVEPHQPAMTEEILGRWALAHAHVGEPGDEPPDWAVVLCWLGKRQRPLTALAAKIEETLAARKRTDTPLTWSRLGALYRELGRDGDARRVLLVREIPLLSASEAQGRTGPEVDRILDGGSEQLADFAPHLGRPGVAAAVFARLADHVSSRLAAMPWTDLRRCLDLAEGLDPGASEAAGWLLAASAWSPGTGSPETGGERDGWLLDRCTQLPPVASHPTRFAAEALTAAGARLLPVCNGAAPASNKQEIVTAVAILLETRGRHPAAFGADSELMRVAVRGRVLAAGADSRGEKDAASRLDSIWGSFLRQAAQGTAFDDPAPREALEWLDLLQDEIFAEPPKKPSEESALAVFFDLAWNLWGREPPASPTRNTLSFKLRWALRLADAEPKGWFPIQLAERWRPRSVADQATRQRERIRRRVPRPLWPEAERLLSPPVLRSTERGESP